jgi:hypothetical protein
MKTPTVMSRALLAAALVASMSCASSKPSGSPSPSPSPSQAGKGFRVLEAVVSGRQYDPPGSPGTTMGGSGSYSLDFEAKDGEATVHYHFPVTRDQYNRYHEGDRVMLYLGDNDLRDIRSVN